MTTLNAHRLFAGTETKPGFKQNISLSQKEWDALTGARDLIRNTLRQGFSALSNTPRRKALLLERRHVILAQDQNFRMAPRFRMQGSFSYRTVNQPAWIPPQEIDLDDGVYLPTSFTSQTTPVIAATAFFQAVEDMLQPLCDEKGWTLCKDKSSCVRVIVSESVHLDLPLYTIPDEDFHDPEVVAKADGVVLDEALRAEISDEGYEELPKDRIMLALRNGRWEQSDPRKMENWFQAAVNEHGQHLRRTSRYLKAWRDWHWPVQGDGMSSICLMACVVCAFDEPGIHLSEDRDDLALQHVASRLPGLLAGSIRNPVVEGMFLDDKWTQEQRNGYVARAQELQHDVERALCAASPETVIATLRQVFGIRMPGDVSLIVPDALEAEILGMQPRKVAAPAVPRSTSG